MSIVVLATVPSQMAVVGVRVTVGSHAHTLGVLNRSVATSVEFDLLVLLTLEWSHDNVSVVSPKPSTDSAHCVISLGGSSDAVGSSVEDEPLLFFSWVVVLKSESMLVATPCLHGDSSVAAHF